MCTQPKDVLSVELMHTMMTAAHNLSERVQMLRALGFSELSAGCFKRTYSHDSYEYVVKLIMSDSTYGANEAENYDEAPPDIKPYLLPLLAHAHTHQIQRKVEGSENCPDGCPIFGYEDLSSKNHVHLADGTPAVYDYGQVGQWAHNWYKEAQEERRRKEEAAKADYEVAA